MLVGSLLAVYVHRARRQQRAADAIRRLGGVVAYDYQLQGDLIHAHAASWVPSVVRRRLGDDLFHTVIYIHVAYRADRAAADAPGPVDDEFLSGLDEFPGLSSVALRFGPRSDDGLREIGRLRRLKHLALLNSSFVTDRGIVELTSLRNLETLALCHTGITDESVRILGELPRLHNLDLRDNSITNQCLLHAGRMQPLKELWVGSGTSNAAITDEGMPHLMALSNLEGLDLEGTAVTERGLVRIAPLELRWMRLQRTGVRDSTKVSAVFPHCYIDW